MRASGVRCLQTRRWNGGKKRHAGDETEMPAMLEVEARVQGDRDENRDKAAEGGKGRSVQGILARRTVVQ